MIGHPSGATHRATSEAKPLGMFNSLLHSLNWVHTEYMYSIPTDEHISYHFTMDRDTVRRRDAQLKGLSIVTTDKAKIEKPDGNSRTDPNSDIQVVCSLTTESRR